MRSVMLDRHTTVLTAVCKELIALTEKYGSKVPSGRAAGLIAIRLENLDKNSEVNVAAEMKIRSLDVADALANRPKQLQSLVTSPVHNCPYLSEHLSAMKKQSILSLKLDQVRQQLNDTSNIDLIADFEQRLRVLEMLSYIDADRAIQLKGRVACEINTCDSLIVTELIFENVFVGLKPEEVVSLLSCLIFHEKDADPPVLTERLKKVMRIEVRRCLCESM